MEKLVSIKILRPITFNILKDDHHLDDIKGIVG
jgi:hypothetical protein